MGKKWLIGAAAAAVGAGLLLWSGRESVVLTVETVELCPSRVEQTVTCPGVVEPGDTRGVFAPISCVIGQVYVKPGQTVEPGEAVASVDKEATRQQVDNPASLLILAAMPDTLTAGEAGIAVDVKAKPGQLLERGTPAAAIALRSGLQVRMTLREKDLPAVRDGQEVRLSGAGFAAPLYRGRLRDIASAATANGNGPVVTGVVELDEGEADASWRLGLSAKAAVVTRVTEQGLLVPYGAVAADESGREYVYLYEEGAAKLTWITAAAHLRDGVLLADNRLQGAKVILAPETIPRDGEPVQKKEAAP